MGITRCEMRQSSSQKSLHWFATRTVGTLRTCGRSYQEPAQRTQAVNPLFGLRHQTSLTSISTWLTDTGGLMVRTDCEFTRHVVPLIQYRRIHRDPEETLVGSPWIRTAILFQPF